MPRLLKNAQRLLRHTLSAALLTSLVACQLPQPTQLPQLPLGRGLSQPLVNALGRNPAERFQWGVSSAGYQAEGNETNSQWYYWEQAGKTQHRSGKAVDFYHRYEEDILLAKQMGVNAFRISVEWSRIEPRPGEIDPVQMAFYKNLVKTIRKHGMEPLVTLLHFTYPHWLDNDTDRDGVTGWEDPDTVDAYLNYVGVVARELSPDVRFWITFNEPNIWLPIAHLAGKTPPGGTNPFGLLRAGRNVLQAHGRAYDRIHGIRSDAMVSSNIFQFMYNPFARSAKSYAASATALSEPTIRAFADTDWFMEALEGGEFAYDNHLQAYFEPRHYRGGVSAMNNGTVSLLGRFDYVAFDYYYRFTKLQQILDAHSTWRMPIYPEGLYNVLINYQRRFRKPIVIAENGIGLYNNQPREDGWKRGDHIVQHVAQMQRAMQDGANVIGYYHWSITDNYEWGSFDSRFGLYTVDALNDPELKRIPTDGVAAYQAVIAGQGVTGSLAQRYPGPRR
ncbi:MAG: glycoside hydrolase family 1 protein [Candidatus Sericytochromatia bacterium]